MNKTRKLTHKSIVISLLQFSNLLKLFHWNTRSYALHISSDTLYTSLSSNIDKLIEILLGNNRLSPFNASIQIATLSNDKFFKKITSFKSLILSIRTNDNVANICDDILNDVDHFIYQSSLS
jgi:DNA-binding ferritin-like protein